jgi:hypothetical protein
MKTTSSVLTVLSLAGLAFTMGACGGGGGSSSTAAGVAAPAVASCVYTQVGMLPQGSCPAGQGQIIVSSSGYTAGQCVPSTGGVNTGAYPYGTNGINTGAYPYNTGVNQGYYGGQSLGLDGGQCTGQNGINGIGNGQCVQTQYGCLYQGPCGVGQLQYTQSGIVTGAPNCAPYSYFGVQGNIGTGLPGVAPMPYGYIPPGGYMPGGGGNFGGYYYGMRTW